jgi:hypothetical protein
MAYRSSAARPLQDTSLWDVADLDGNVLATRITRAQICARLEADLLPGAALVLRRGEREWRPLSDVLGGSGVRRVVRKWYLTRPGAIVVGPVETSLVERGILAGKVPLDSRVCEVGDATWAPLASVDAFRRAIEETLFDDEVTCSIDVGI